MIPGAPEWISGSSSYFAYLSNVVFFLSAAKRSKNRLSPQGALYFTPGCFDHLAFERCPWPRVCSSRPRLFLPVFHPVLRQRHLAFGLRLRQGAVFGQAKKAAGAQEARPPGRLPRPGGAPCGDGPATSCPDEDHCEQNQLSTCVRRFSSEYGITIQNEVRCTAAGKTGRP